MYTRVLVPLDGSTTALQVIPYATLFAKSTGASIALLQVINGYPKELVTQVSHEFIEGRPSYPPSLQTWASVQEEMRKNVQQHLEEAAEPIRAEGVTVETLVAENDPADAIVIEAERDKGTLIAISTHGRTGVGRWVLGSVTDAVIRQAENPTLVVRAREDEVTSAHPTLGRVVVPLDGSELAETALPHAVEAAKALSVGITLVRSISPMAYGDTFADYVPSMYEDLAGEIEADVRDHLSGQADELRKAGVSDVTEKSVDGYAGSAILDEVGDDGDKLVVMATHGRSGIGRWVLGSVADRVIRHSPGPVLVVPPHAHE